MPYKALIVTPDEFERGEHKGSDLPVVVMSKEGVAQPVFDIQGLDKCCTVCDGHGLHTGPCYSCGKKQPPDYWEKKNMSNN